jgi:hypothetical protein
MDVADGSKAVILKAGNDFRSSPDNVHLVTASACPLRAKFGSRRFAAALGLCGTN